MLSEGKGCRRRRTCFFVTCKRTTMMQDDIDNGRLISQIGIAPVRPAEFVIFASSRREAQPD
jgi:uncharacterized protein